MKPYRVIVADSILPGSNQQMKKPGHCKPNKISAWFGVIQSNAKSNAETAKPAARAIQISLFRLTFSIYMTLRFHSAMRRTWTRNL